MEIDGSLEHSKKKLKTSTLEETNTAVPAEPAATQEISSQNDRMPEPPKITMITPLPKTEIVPNVDPQQSELPNIKFSHNNPYIVIAPTQESHKEQGITMQLPDTMQITQDKDNHAYDPNMEMTSTLEEERRAVLEDESIYLDDTISDTNPQNKDDDAISTISNTKSHIMDTHALPNATV